MKKFLTTLAVLTAFATPVFAQSFDPTAPQNDKIARSRSGLHSFALVPRVQAVRPGYNFPYPDRPYGDPDHW
jgi:hypothetical protein